VEPVLERMQGLRLLPFPVRGRAPFGQPRRVGEVVLHGQAQQHLAGGPDPLVQAAGYGRATQFPAQHDQAAQQLLVGHDRHRPQHPPRGVTGHAGLAPAQ